MAFEAIPTGRRYPKWGECTAGEVVVEGVFKEKFKGRFGAQYLFSTETGDVVLSKSGQFDNQMEKVTPGQIVRVVYGGKDVMKNGPFKGKEVHRIAVLVDKDGKLPEPEKAEREPGEDEPEDEVF